MEDFYIALIVIVSLLIVDDIIMHICNAIENTKNNKVEEKDDND